MSAAFTSRPNNAVRGSARNLDPMHVGVAFRGHEGLDVRFRFLGVRLARRVS
jgi:hypothetical protein